MSRIVGADKHTVKGLIDNTWQLHTTHIGIIGRGAQSRFTVGVDGLFKLWNSLHFTVDKLGFISIQLGSAGQKLVFRDRLTEIHHRVQGLTVIIGETLRFKNRLKIQSFIKDKIEISTINNHGHSSSLLTKTDLI